MRTILLIETDPATLVTLSLILRSFGYTVLEAGSLDEVWHSWYEHQGPIDMVLMKANPDGSTSEFIARLQCLCPQIRALFVYDASSAELARIPCEYASLRIPFHYDALVDTIRQLLDGPKKRAVSSVS